MSIKRLCLASLFPCFIAADVHGATWEYTFEGFRSGETGLIVHSWIQGNFTGTDQDGNGVIDQGELSEMYVGGREYLSCAEETDPYSSCGLSSFSYTPGGDLNFSASNGWRDPEGMRGAYESIRTGVSRVYSEYFHNVTQTTTWNWSDETDLIVLSPVPEPASAAMLLLGVLGLAGLKKSSPVWTRKYGSPLRAP